MTLFSFGEPPYYLILTVDALVILSSVTLVTRFACKAGVGSLARSFLQAVGFASQHGVDEVDPFRQRVTEKLLLIQRERMNVACAMWLVMLTAALLLSCLAIAQDIKTWNSVYLNYFFCVSVVAFALIVSCCQFSSSWQVQATYALMMTSTSLWVHLLAPMLARRSDLLMVPLACVRCAFCFTCIDFRAVVFWGSICLVGDPWLFLGTAPSRRDGTMTIVISCFLLIVTLVISALMERATRAALRQDFSMKAYRLEQSASNLLLEHVCDAVLPVDADLQINGSADRFAAMLMLDSRRCQGGTDVQEFMPFEEDRERFHKQFRSPSERPELVPQVSCMNVNLRDGGGNNVRAELIGVPFKNLNNDINYKFGFRESLDGQNFPIRDLGGHQARPARNCPNRGAHARMDAEVADDNNTSASASTFSRASYHVTSLAAPAFVETSLRGQITSLVRLMATLNLSTTWRSCQLRTVLDDLNAAPCRHGLHDEVSSQCRECGVLDSFDENNMCLCCGCECTSIPL
eukprot:TRINITY_DN4462_c0_g1_i2.p1 TRINITY_DN4462_c0_g1~~TRINITY_DN4462_c0_g1_i2.p1  ORF type:complete len:518 (+),score=40.06 TRINITY_DN4462_c0_g1_i2:31-1584(+)